MPLQKAFISDAAFTIDDHGYAAVVTAKALDADTSKLEITCDILGYVEPISITLDQDDFKAMRELLGLPDPAKFYDGAQAAIAAIEKIAVLFEKDEKDVTRWKGIALEAIQLAQHALAKIGYPEADDGTPSDS